MTDQETLFHKAQELFIEGHPEESIEFFSKAEEEGCNPVEVYLSRGAAFLKIGEYEKAIEDFGRLLEIDIKNERAYFYRGIAQMNKGGFDSAVTDLTKSIELNHERGVAFFARALCLAELDRMDEAGRDMKTAIAFSNIEIEKFANTIGENRTLFGRSMALLEGERGPWKIVLDESEVHKLKKWLE
jgi:tetratricopeptide (TPR) repeat protein